jgi:CRP/FNR family transcriptional regulator
MLDMKVLPVRCAETRAANACDSCGARQHSVCGALDNDVLGRLDALADRISLRPGDVLVRQGEPADHLFNITSGSVRVYRLLPDGRRQITGFLFAGDFLGLAAGQTYDFSAEAIEASTACRFRRIAYREEIRRNPSLEAALFDRMTRELAAAQAQMLLLGRKTAQERIASFLLDLPDHDPCRPGPKDQVRLPMTRAEIADYLGLTIETVSRVLTRFKTTGVIRLLSLNDLRIEQPDYLRAIAEGEV